MEVEYNLTLQDVAAFARFHQKHGPKLKPPLLVRVVSIGFGLVIVPLAAFAGWFHLQPGGDWLSGCCAGVIVGFLMTVLVFGWLQKKTVISNAIRLYDREENRWLLAQRRLRITADGIEITNESQQLWFTWPVVWLIDSTDEYAFFYTTRNNAHIIPRRAFRDQQHFEEFIDLACRYQKGLLPRESPSTDILDALPAHPTGITRPHHP